MKNSLLQMSDRSHNIVPFVLSVIFTIIRVLVDKSQIFWRLGTGNSSLCGTFFITDSISGYLTLCLDLEVIYFMFVKQK